MSVLKQFTFALKEKFKNIVLLRCFINYYKISRILYNKKYKYSIL